MMNLEVQIQSLIYSLIFGMIASLVFNIIYKYLFHVKKTIKFIFTELYIIISVILYFAILRKINYGIVNHYFLIMILIGFLIGNRKTRLIRTHCIKKEK